MIGLPDMVLQFLEVFSSAKIPAYLVGGCVRDLLLGNTPHDWDIATIARPEQVQALFPRTVATGIQHGTVTVLWEQHAFEVTTFRTDGNYQDHRHPTQVCFSTSMQKDASRRDFTINAMYYHPSTGLYDFFGGQEDLERKQIRTVGDAAQRFEEDALRILRAARFAAQLEFCVSPQTTQAMQQKAELLKTVSRERIGAEFCKLVQAPGTVGIEVLQRTHCLEGIHPSLCFHEEDIGVCYSLPSKLSLRLAVLLQHSIHPTSLLHSLRLPKKTIQEALALLQHKQAPLETEADLQALAYRLSPSLVQDLYQWKKQLPLPNLTWIGLRELAINGSDLLAKHVPPEQIGQELEKALQAVWNHIVPNEKEALLTLLPEK